MKAQNGKEKKKNEKSTEEKVNDVKKAITSRGIDLNQSPSKMYENTKSYIKDVGSSIGKLFGFKAGGQPKPENYVGRPMSFFADQAEYGREMARREIMKRNGGGYDFEKGNAANGKIIKGKR